MKCGDAERIGIHVLNGYCGVPRDGLLEEFALRLPAYTQACFFSQDGTEWPSSSNRVLPWVAGSDITTLFRDGYRQDLATGVAGPDGVFALLQLTDGEYLALLPMTCELAMSWLHVDPEKGMSLRVGTLGTAEVKGDIPLVCWARSADLYEACNEAWEQAVDHVSPKGALKLRSEKEYKEPFRYLGWCTWAEYYGNIDSDLLVGVADAIHASPLPIRWLLVDDGHQDVEGKEMKSTLKSAAPNGAKFPEGWGPLLSKRRKDGLKWFGLWHSFIGHWNGICPEQELGLQDDELFARDMLLPGKDKRAAMHFFETLIGSARDYGFDFVKIDVQSWFLERAAGMPNPVRMNADLAQALEEVCEHSMNGLINCMALNSVCIFNTRYSNVTRCSIDYQADRDVSAKSHLRQSFSNTLWLGQTVWPDHDMFHGTDSFCGRIMAISKALSGAPVYLSDAPEKLDAGVTLPLVYEDGRVLRPEAPAAPLPESVFSDALNEPVAYRVIAPLSNGCAAVALYNLVHSGAPDDIPAGVAPDDYRSASAMIQPYPGPWSVPDEGLVVYDWHEGKGARLEDSYEVMLSGFSDRLLHLCPIRHGWAVIGRPDKYLSPAAVQSAVCTHDECRLVLVESGPVVIWTAEGTPVPDRGEKVEELGNGFWRVALSPGVTEYAVTLRK